MAESAHCYSYFTDVSTCPLKTVNFPENNIFDFRWKNYTNVNSSSMSFVF